MLERNLFQKELVVFLEGGWNLEFITFQVKERRGVKNSYFGGVWTKII